MLALLRAALLLLPGLAAGAELVVFMPERPLPPHEEALLGLCETLGRCPETLSAGAPLPKDARVVVAIGGEAARRRYPSRVTLVTALTPGLGSPAGTGAGSWVRVTMRPSPADFLAALRSHRPVPGRVALLWASRAHARYVGELAALMRGAGLEPDARRLDAPEDLPALLRSIERPDAVWLAPDPELVTPVNYALLKEYAKSGPTRFLAPAPGLAAAGADASVAPSFRSVGARAGQVARDALAGREIPQEAYPDLSALSGPGVSVSTAASAR